MIKIAVNDCKNMVRRFPIYAFVVFVFSRCGNIEEPAEKLYLNYVGKEVPECFENFQGMGKEVFPDFLSWSVFKYSTSYDCLEKVYINDTVNIFINTLKDGTIVKDERFKWSDCKYFPGDLSFYQDAIDKGIIESKYSCDNKLHIYGIKYPYVHDILYDTIFKNVIHLVSTIRE